LGFHSDFAFGIASPKIPNLTPSQNHSSLLLLPPLHPPHTQNISISPQAAPPSSTSERCSFSSISCIPPTSPQHLRALLHCRTPSHPRLSLNLASLPSLHAQENQFTGFPHPLRLVSYLAPDCSGKNHSPADHVPSATEPFPFAASFVTYNSPSPSNHRLPSHVFNPRPPSLKPAAAANATRLGPSVYSKPPQPLVPRLAVSPRPCRDPDLSQLAVLGRVTGPARTDLRRAR
jgi:hypothetical protein